MQRHIVVDLKRKQKQMTEEQFAYLRDKVELNDDDYLVEEIDHADYYGTNSFMINKDFQYTIGRIVSAGFNVEAFIGKTIFFHKNIGTVVRFKKMPKLIIISKSAQLAIITETE